MGVRSSSPAPQDHAVTVRLGPEPNLATSAESWITAGDPQYTELSTAAEIHQLVDFGNLLTVDLLIIDGATDRRDVAVRIE